MAESIIIAIMLVIIAYFIVSLFNKKKKKEIIDPENLTLVQEGYKKLVSELYLNEEEKMISINNKKYAFSQIVDCTLEEKMSIYNGLTYCVGIQLTVLVNDLSNPSQVIYSKCGYYLSDSRYLTLSRNFSNAESTLKVITHSQKEDLKVTGTVTKIEHRYITEEDATQQIQKLSDLYKSGVLNEFEFETKKKELLDKVK